MDDRKIKELLKTDKGYHLKMADKFISKLKDKAKESGTTREHEARLYQKMKHVEEIKRKIKTGSLSEADTI